MSRLKAPPPVAVEVPDVTVPPELKDRENACWQSNRAFSRWCDRHAGEDLRRDAALSLKHNDPDSWWVCSPAMSRFNDARRSWLRGHPEVTDYRVAAAIGLAPEFSTRELFPDGPG